MSTSDCIREALMSELDEGRVYGPSTLVHRAKTQLEPHDDGCGPIDDAAIIDELWVLVGEYFLTYSEDDLMRRAGDIRYRHNTMLVAIREPAKATKPSSHEVSQAIYDVLDRGLASQPHLIVRRVGQQLGHADLPRYMENLWSMINDGLLTYDDGDIHDGQGRVSLPKD